MHHTSVLKFYTLVQKFVQFLQIYFQYIFKYFLFIVIKCYYTNAPTLGQRLAGGLQGGTSKGTIPTFLAV